MNRLLILLAVCFVGFGQCLAQNIYIHKTDGQTEVYPLIDVTSITFDENVMNLNLITEDTISWNFSQIRYYNYDQWYVSVPQGLIIGEGGVNVFPNPAQDQFTIEYELTAKSDVEVSLVDIQGRLITKRPISSVNPGLQQIKFNTTDLNASAGTYVVQVIAGKSRFNKILLINE